MDVKDFVNLFTTYGAAFEAAADLTAFAAAVGAEKPGLGEVIGRYAGEGKWAERYFATAKAHGVGRLWKSLTLPHATRLADVFEAFAVCQSTPGDRRRGSWPENLPLGFYFLGSYSATIGGELVDQGEGRPKMHRGGRFTSVYVRPRREVMRYPDASDRQYRGQPGGIAYDFPGANAPADETETDYYARAYGLGFDITERTDGYLIIAQASQIIGSHWLAFLPELPSIDLAAYVGKGAQPIELLDNAPARPRKREAA